MHAARTHANGSVVEFSRVLADVLNGHALMHFPGTVDHKVVAPESFCPRLVTAGSRPMRDDPQNRPFDDRQP